MSFLYNYEFLLKEGVVLYKGKRVAVIDYELFHFLWHDLQEHMGKPKAEKTFVRFGYSAGFYDAIQSLSTVHESSLKVDAWHTHCFRMITERGIAVLELKKQEKRKDHQIQLLEVCATNFGNDTLWLENLWLEHFVKGYLSGFVSEYVGQHIFFQPLSLTQDTILFTGTPLNENERKEQKEIKAVSAQSDKSGSESNYRDLYVHAPFPYFTLDTSGKILECNETFYSNLGYKCGEVINKHVSDFFEDLTEKKLDEFFALQSEIKNYEGVVTLQNGTPRFVSIVATVECSADGSVSKMRCAILDISNLKNAEMRLKQENTILETMVKIDPLTNVYNKRYLLQALDVEFEKALRHNYPLSIMILDMDRFKQINDYFGHPAGDKALRIVARLIRKNIRKGDIVARYGGEEFVVLAPFTDSNGAFEIADKIRAIIEEFGKAEIEPGVFINTTASIGVASLQDGNYSDLASLLQAADNALLKSKRQGRNRVTHCL